MIPSGFRGAALPRSPRAIANAAAIIKCSPDVLQAVIDIETSGSGFLPDGRPKMLYERHYFHRLTKGQFDVSHPGISRATPGGYLGGAREYGRLAGAMALNRMAALESASWGLPQIMGSNYRLAGYPDAESMVAAFCSSEDEQLLAMARFIVAAGLADEMQREDIANFARGYNGPSYAVNQYDKKIVNDLTRIRFLAGADISTAWPAERQRIAKVQAALNLHGFGPLDPDGWSGPKTRAGLIEFQTSNRLAVTGAIDAATLAALTG
jgi:hypothetical protein